MKHHYCSGSCHGQPKEEEIHGGKSACDTSGCTMVGKTFIECECDNSSVHSEDKHASVNHHQHDQE